MRFFSCQVVHLYSNTDTAVSLKKPHLISDFVLRFFFSSFGDWGARRQTFAVNCEGTKQKRDLFLEVIKKLAVGTNIMTDFLDECFRQHLLGCTRNCPFCTDCQLSNNYLKCLQQFSPVDWSCRIIPIAFLEY